MSIIEKALEKLDDAPPERQAEKQQRSHRAVELSAQEQVQVSHDPRASEPPGDPVAQAMRAMQSEPVLRSEHVVRARQEQPAESTSAPGQDLPGQDLPEQVIPEDATSHATEPTTDRVSRKVDLDLARLERAGFLTPSQAQSLIAEEYRHLKRPVLRRAAVGDPDHLDDGNLVIITSSLPGEGKTYMSVNLAMSMAMEVDRTVLLVDADVAKADVSRVLGVHDELGLSSYLSEKETDLSKLILRTNVEKLAILPSGPHYSKLTELLASRQMVALVAELAERYPDRIVLFDSPPLLATSGAPVLTSLMGQVLMVVESVRTPRSAVKAALKRMAGARNVSFVLNKQRNRSGSGYGGYGHGYGYDRAYGARPMDSA